MISLIASKPLKAIPKRLCYYTVKNNLPPNPVHDFMVLTYNMADTKTGELLGEMIVSPMIFDGRVNKKIYPEEKGFFKSLQIFRIMSFERGVGVGSDFIKVAKSESKRFGCDGRVNVISSPVYDRKNPPHVFYKKNGFTSVSEIINNKLNECIIQKKKASFKNITGIHMYLPIQA